MIASRAAARPPTMPIVRRVTSRTHSKERTPSSSFHIRANTLLIRNSLYQVRKTRVEEPDKGALRRRMLVPAAPTFLPASDKHPVCRVDNYPHRLARRAAYHLAAKHLDQCAGVL